MDGMIYHISRSLGLLIMKKWMTRELYHSFRKNVENDYSEDFEKIFKNTRAVVPILKVVRCNLMLNNPK